MGIQPGASMNVTPNPYTILQIWHVGRRSHGPEAIKEGQNRPLEKNYFSFPIRKTPVPHVGHVPLVASRPFFNTTGSRLGTSLLSLHLTQ